MLPISFLCQQYGLGQALTSPVALQGGLMHEMWHIVTTSGHFAIKRVNQHNIRLLANTIMHIQSAELLAQHYQQRGLSVRVACQSVEGNWAVKCENNHSWMVFPWIEGQVKTLAEITTDDARGVGKLLAQLHAESIPSVNLTLPNWFGFASQHWQQLSAQAARKNLPWVALATQKSSVLHYWNEQALRIKPFLTDTLVVSHRDVSMSNTVWREDGLPVLIDWEYAGWVNPQSEIFNTAMTWSNQEDIRIFNAIVNAAGYEFHITDEKLLAGYAGYLLEWCEFNMQRSLSDTDAIATASAEVINVITILSRLLSNK